MLWSNLCRRSFHTTAALTRNRIVYYNKHKRVTDPARQDPDYFEKQAAKLPLDELYIDNLKLLWDEKVGSERDLLLKASDKLIGRTEGDYGLPKIAPLRPKIEYESVEELKTAPDEVKKIFSIEFGERSDYTNACKKDLIDLVKVHQYDKESLQMKIAWSTVVIRHMTALIDELTKRSAGRRPKHYSHKVMTLIGFRRRQLRLLREQNYDEFVKILDTLKISYHVQKEPEHVKTRKAWSLFNLQKRVEAEKEKIMENLRVQFEDNKEVRLKQLNAKLETLVTQQQEIQQQLKEFEVIEDRVPANVVGKYEPKLIEEFRTASIHTRLFYHPNPVKRSI